MSVYLQDAFTVGPTPDARLTHWVCRSCAADPDAPVTSHETLTDNADFLRTLEREHAGHETEMLVVET